MSNLQRSTPPPFSAVQSSPPILFAFFSFPSAPTSFSPSRFRVLRARCSNNVGFGGGSGSGSSISNGENVVNFLSGPLGDQVEALLQREENRTLLDRLEQSARRVELAKEALVMIRRQEDQAAHAKEIMLSLEEKEFEIAKSQREILEARMMIEEAEHALSSNMDQVGFGHATEKTPDEFDGNTERLESIKAAAVSSIIGTIAALPICFYKAAGSPQLLQSLTVIFISCAIFGVTFRYTIRRDFDNIQLKTGASAGFGFVKGLAALDATRPFVPSIDSLLSQVADGALHVSESVLIFIFSSIALDFCFKTGLLSPFPIKK